MFSTCACYFFLVLICSTQKLHTSSIELTTCHCFDCLLKKNFILSIVSSFE